MCCEFQDYVATLHEPTVMLNNIPWEYREEMREFLKKATKAAFLAGSQYGKEEQKSQNRHMLMMPSHEEWFDDNLSNLFK